MADKPSAVRNFFGRLWDGATPGVRNYDRQTGQFYHTGAGLAQVGARALGMFTGNPLIGTLASRAIGKYANAQDAQPTAVEREGIPIYGAPPSVQSAFVAPTLAAAPNLGFPSQSPGGTWAGYLQGQGSVNNFGNSQFGNGMASVPGNWAPASTWGQGIQEGQGSNLNFGNYSPGANAASGGAGRGGSAGANRGMQVGSYSSSSGMGPGGARGSFLEKINRRGLNIN